MEDDLFTKCFDLYRASNFYIIKKKHLDFFKGDSLPPKGGKKGVNINYTCMHVTIVSFAYN